MINAAKELKASKHRILLSDGSALQYHPPFSRPGEELTLRDYLPTEWNFAKQCLEVEIGCGKGEFIAQRAAQFPERFFVGIDRRLDRHRLTENKLKRLPNGESKNWTVLQEDARVFLAKGLPPIHTLHVYHPDPWPKSRHHKHRFFRSPVARAWAEALVPGGFLRLSTDHAEYYTEILSVLDSWPFLERICAFTKKSGTAVTHFEKIFLSKGEPVFKAAYLRR